MKQDRKTRIASFPGHELAGFLGKLNGQVCYWAQSDIQWERQVPLQGGSEIENPVIMASWVLFFQRNIGMASESSSQGLSKVRPDVKFSHVLKNYVRKVLQVEK